MSGHKEEEEEEVKAETTATGYMSFSLSKPDMTRFAAWRDMVLAKCMDEELAARARKAPTPHITLFF